MVKTKQLDIPAEQLCNFVVKGMLEKKALDVVVMDLRNVKNAIADYFVICSGNSDTQLDAIAGSDVPIPETIRDMVALQLDGLTGPGRDALELAALLGEEFDLDLLGELCAHETAVDDDDEANDDQYDDARDGRQYDDERPYEGGRSNQVEHARQDDVDEEGLRNRKWRRRVEQALVKMTAEVAALREQLESNRLYGGRRRRPLWDWLLWLVLSTLKHALIDAVLLGIALLWMRRKRDKRLEQALLMAVGIVREKARALKFPKR